MSSGQPVREFTAAQYHEHLAEGRADAVEFFDRLLVDARAADAPLHAFASLDERVIRFQAEHLRALRARGDPLPPLYGVPIAVKDIIDTIDFPTACGSPIHEGRYASADATIVRRLREAGALIFGKSVTTEFATFVPGTTRNPHDLEHTPGGSSSGSAAAVAAGIVPAALGTQTNGSVLRPASYCGIYGFKPTRGVLPRSGIFDQSPSLDQPGLFARSIDDLALITEVMSGDDGLDAVARGIAPRRLLQVSRSEPPVTPRFCFVRTPWWEQMDEEARQACDAFVELMAGAVDVAELPDIVRQVVGWHAALNDAELAFALQREYRHHRELLSAPLCERVEQGQRVPVIDYLTARDRMAHVAVAFDEYFDRYDAILTPAALGAAPRGFTTTGNPIMQTVWSFGGLPSVSLPLLHLSGDMPLGVQTVGRLHHDGRLLRSARWLVDEFLNRSR
jgi:Asp-tRNA(Asn)/Glu-tRNA(Gln) amidotransferase A subunit family amidase